MLLLVVLLFFILRLFLSFYSFPYTCCYCCCYFLDVVPVTLSFCFLQLFPLFLLLLFFFFNFCLVITASLGNIFIGIVPALVVRNHEVKEWLGVSVSCVVVVFVVVVVVVVVVVRTYISRSLLKVAFPMFSSTSFFILPFIFCLCDCTAYSHDSLMQYHANLVDYTGVCSEGITTDLLWLIL